MKLQPPANIVSGKLPAAGAFQLRSFGDTVSNLATSQCWGMPHVAGAAIRLYWTQIQPTSQSSYDWSYIDGAISLAQTNNQAIGICIAMGNFCPRWVYSTPGITAFTSTGPQTIQQCFTTRGQTLVTCPATSCLIAGSSVIAGNGIPAGATVANIVSETTFNLSVPATATGSPNLTAAPLRMPAPWDTAWQGVLQTFVQAFAARYDNNPNVAYVIMSGFGQQDQMGISNSTTDDTTIATTTYGGVTGLNLITNAFQQIANIWMSSFMETQVICNMFQVSSVDNKANLNYSVQLATTAIQTFGPGRFGIKNNNLTSSLQTVTVPFSTLMTQVTGTNPVGLQMEFSSPLSGGGFIASAALGAQIGMQFLEVYGSQLPLLTAPAISNLPTQYPTAFAVGLLGAVKCLGVPANCGSTQSVILPDQSAMVRTAFVTDGSGNHEVVVTHSVSLFGDIINFAAPNSGVMTQQDTNGFIKGNPSNS